MKRIFTTFVCAFAVCAAADAQQRSGAPASCPQADTVLLSADVDGTYLVRKYLVKQHADRNSDYAVRYQVDVAQLSSTLAGNARQLDDLQAFIDKVSQDKSLRVTGVTITGYASPDGPYYNNETLAKARSTGFKSYLTRSYGLQDYPLRLAWVAEDWEGLRPLLRGKPYEKAALFIIDNYGVFEGRERFLMELDGGRPYKEMLHELFPRLRRLEIHILYNEQIKNDETEVPA